MGDLVYLGADLSVSLVFTPAYRVLVPRPQTQSLTPPGPEPSSAHLLIRKVFFLSIHTVLDPGLPAPKPWSGALCQEPYWAESNLELDTPLNREELPGAPPKIGQPGP